MNNDELKALFNEASQRGDTEYMKAIERKLNPPPPGAPSDAVATDSFNATQEYFGQLKKDQDSRVDAFSDILKRRDSGETGAVMGGLQMANQGVLKPVLDTVGTTVASVAKAYAPDALKESFSSAVNYLTGTDSFKYMEEEWGKLDDNEKANIGAFGNFASLIVPGIKVRSAAKGRLKAADLAKRKKTIEIIKAPDKKNSKQLDWERMGAEDPKLAPVTDTVTEVKGFHPLKSSKANYKALNNELDVLEKELVSKVRRNKVTLGREAVNDVVDSTLDRVYETMKSEIKADATVAKYLEAQGDALREIIKKHPSTPEGILMARREFDLKLKNKSQDIFSSDPKFVLDKEIGLELRRALNNMAGSTEIGTKQSHLFIAMKNISEKASKAPSLKEKVVNNISAHPFLVLSAVSGGGVGALTMGTAGAIGAGAVTGAVASKLPYNRMLGTALDTAGKIVDPIPKIIPRAGMFNSANEERQ